MVPTTAKEMLREEVIELLSCGLETRQEPVPATSAEAAQILDELAGVTILADKLIIAGYSLTAHGEHRCSECIYFRISARWCALPALDLPAERSWWCRLWRM
jgi:hypothetical protein